jgi:hypothetical protein
MCYVYIRESNIDNTAGRVKDYSSVHGNFVKGVIWWWFCEPKHVVNVIKFDTVILQYWLYHKRCVSVPLDTDLNCHHKFNLISWTKSITYTCLFPIVTDTGGTEAYINKLFVTSRNQTYAVNNFLWTQQRNIKIGLCLLCLLLWLTPSYVITRVRMFMT